VVSPVWLFGDVRTVVGLEQAGLIGGKGKGLARANPFRDAGIVNPPRSALLSQRGR
jgi:hypothetical protein